MGLVDGRRVATKQNPKMLTVVHTSALCDIKRKSTEKKRSQRRSECPLGDKSRMVHFQDKATPAKKKASHHERRLLHNSGAAEQTRGDQRVAHRNHPTNDETSKEKHQDTHKKSQRPNKNTVSGRRCLSRNRHHASQIYMCAKPKHVTKRTACARHIRQQTL